MKILKNCKTCEVEFTAIKEAQYFCSRKCFKKDYYKRNKKRQEALDKLRPVYNCSACGKASEVPFDPVKNYSRYSEFKCPHCFELRSDLVDKEKKMVFLD